MYLERNDTTTCTRMTRRRGAKRVARDSRQIRLGSLGQKFSVTLAQRYPLNSVSGSFWRLRLALDTMVLSFLHVNECHWSLLGWMSTPSPSRNTRSLRLLISSTQSEARESRKIERFMHGWVLDGRSPHNNNNNSNQQRQLE
jgi:hypothetical protein